MECRNPRKTLAAHHLLRALLLLLPNPISSQSPAPHSRAHAASRILLGALLGSLTGILASAAALLLFRLLLRYVSRTPILHGPVVFSHTIAPKSLHLALSTHNPTTHPLSGSYFRVTLENEVTVAVKVLDPGLTTASNSLKRRAQRELETLAWVKHRSVMGLRAYVHDNKRLALVYDYVPGGSLEDAMKRVRSEGLHLRWDARHRIAVGVVKGLKYLHFECNPRILHYGLKPRNVMLDDGFEPRLGDCGLARMVADADAVAGCYVAPECLQSCRYTDKSDVFSFGVILGELLTGRDPSDPFFAAGESRGNLVRWLRQLQQAGETREALDKSLLGEEGEEEEMLMAIRIALVCLSDLPADRPSSDELVAMLTQLHSF